jgi:hypothetical protein
MDVMSNQLKPIYYHKNSQETGSARNQYNFMWLTTSPNKALAEQDHP